MEDISNTAATQGSDEIFFRDEHGVLKVLRNGIISDEEPATRSSAVVTPSAGSTQDSQIRTLIETIGLHFTDDSLQKRFSMLALSYLKEVRDAFEVKEMLTTPTQSGGLGFRKEESERVLTALRGLSGDKGLPLPPAPVPAGGLKPFLSPDEEEDKKEKVKPVVTPPVKPIAKSILAPIVTKPTPPPPASPAPARPAKPLSLPSAPIVPLPSPASPPKVKVQVQDVRFTPRLTGPIEEIRSLTIKDFRGLGATPAEAVAKVAEKLDLLEHESFSKRIEGIKAWKESEVYQVYLAIGSESLSSHDTVAEVLANRTTQGLPSLTEAEIESIMEFNTTLRY